MLRKESKNVARKKRHIRIRKNIIGTVERPRLNIYRSLGNIYAQIINDQTGCTLVSASSLDKDLQSQVEYGGNIEAAKAVGKMIAERAKANGIDKVVFDRGGYIYHGRVAALAQAAREAGLEF